MAWHIRYVRKGRVKIGGIWYAPDTKWKEYGGELDGIAMAFGDYDGKAKGADGRRFINLWGTAACFYCPAKDRDACVCPPDPACIDGMLPWMWWHEQVTDAEEAQ